MLQSEYFLRQAATCVRLAQVCRDLNVARQLFVLAKELRTKAAEIGDDSEGSPRSSFEHGDASRH
jgi:hypothetical protein